MSTNEPTITVETSCGQVFEVKPSQMSNYELAVLLHHTPIRRKPNDAEQRAAMWDELLRRLHLDDEVEHFRRLGGAAARRCRPMSTNEPTITVETSCGQVFEVKPSQMSNYELAVLLHHTPARPKPNDAEQRAAMWDELLRRLRLDDELEHFRRLGGEQQPGGAV
jgi:uncharacterized protein (DUF2236 family)